jgi:antitoxin (DNA-binding transcriptional repressor) of toxin-antitoxin stability system
MAREQRAAHRSGPVPTSASAGGFEQSGSVSVLPLLRFEYAMRLKRLFPRGGRLLALGPVEPDLLELLEDAEGPAIVDGRSLDVRLDGAASGLAEATVSDLERAAADLRDRVAPGAPVVIAVAGPRHLRALSAAAGEADARRVCGGSVAWRRRFGLGTLMPAAPMTWPSRFPQAFALLVMADRLVRGWPGFRSRGSSVVLEGHLRDSG